MGVVKTCLIGAGGVRGVTESHAGCRVCALRARRGHSGERRREALQRQKASTRSRSTPKSRSGISSKTTSREKYVLPRWLSNSRKRQTNSS